MIHTALLYADYDELPELDPYIDAFLDILDSNLTELN